MKKIVLPLIATTFIAMSCGNKTSTLDNTASDVKKDSAVVADNSKAETKVLPDSATMMKNWTAYMTPSKPHEMMASWNGIWTANVTMWQAPDAPPEVSKATAVNKMTMGNRYQVGNFTGNMMGQPFEGMSTLAYDNAKKVFITTWIDNMGTGLMKLEGPWDEATKSMTLTGKAVDGRMTDGKEMDIREIFKIVDDNTQVLEMYGPGPDRKEFKMMEITYSRKK
jgi:hypothetical protein